MSLRQQRAAALTTTQALKLAQFAQGNPYDGKGVAVSMKERREKDQARLQTIKATNSLKGKGLYSLNAYPQQVT